MQNVNVDFKEIGRERIIGTLTNAGGKLLEMKGKSRIYINTNECRLIAGDADGKLEGYAYGFFDLNTMEMNVIFENPVFEEAFNEGVSNLFKEGRKSSVSEQVEEEDVVNDDNENKETGLIFDGMTSSEAILSDENPFNKKEDKGTVYISNRVSDESKHEKRIPTVTFGSIELSLEPLPLFGGIGLYYKSEQDPFPDLLAGFLVKEMLSEEGMSIDEKYIELLKALIDVKDGYVLLPNLPNIQYLVDYDTEFPSSLEEDNKNEYRYKLTGGDIDVDIYFADDYDPDEEPVASIEIYGGIREAVYAVRDFLNK